MNEGPELSTASPILDHSTMDHAKCPEGYFLCIMVFTGFIFVVGLTGNIMTIVILRKNWQKSVTRLVLTYLAVADILTLSVYSGMILIGTFFRVADTSYDLFKVAAVSALYVTNTGFIFNQMSISATILVTWQRYLSVCLPHKVKQYGSHRLMSIAIIVSVLFSISFYMLNYFHHKLSSVNGQSILIGMAFAKSKWFTIIYATVLSYVMNYIIPMILLMYMAVGLIKAMWQQSKNTHKGLKRAKEELTKSIVVVIIIFIICQSFGPIRRILQWVYDPYSVAAECGGPLTHFAYFPVLLQIFNSAINFVVYIICTRGFRKILISLFVTNREIVTEDHKEGSGQEVTPPTAVAPTSRCP